MIPDTLNDVVTELKNLNLSFSSDLDDGRQNSVKDEKSIIEKLESLNRWKIIAGKKRDWYDVKIDNYFCNIKVSVLGNQHDNTNANGAIYYFMTGKTTIPKRQKKLFEDMKKYECVDEERDYYYLVFGKSKVDNTCKDIFVVSLKGIKGIRASHHNFPFQCKWEECQEPEKRTWNQAKEYLLEMWKTSIEDAINHHKDVVKSMEEIV